MNRNTLVIILMLSVSVFISPQSVVAQATKTEDFSTRTYLDASRTYGADWDTVSGQLKQIPFEINQIDGPVDTYTGLRVVKNGTITVVSAANEGIRIFQSELYSFTTGVAFNPSGSGYARGAALAENYVYLADGLNGLVTIDLSDIQVPNETAAYNTSGYAWDVAVAGDWAYVADGSAGLLVFDITNPALPVFVTSLALTGNTESVFIDGGMAYLAGTSGLHVVNIAVGSAPTLSATLSLPSSAKDVHVVGQYAYVADGNSGLQIVDISSAGAPVVVGSVDTPGTGSNIEVSGQKAFLTDGSPGLQIIDIADPFTPSIIETYNIPGSANGITISGSRAFIATTSYGVHIAEISVLAAMHRVGADYSAGLSPRKISARGNFVYSVDSSDLVITDVSDRTAPAIVSSTLIPGSPRDMEIVGDHAFVACLTGGPLVAYDISDAAAPVFSSGIVSGSVGRALEIAGDYAYVCITSGGVEVFDIHDPQSIAYVGTLGSSLTYSEIGIFGNYAYLTSFYGDMDIVDIANPVSPVIVGSVTVGGANTVAFAGQRCFVGANDATLKIYDISNPVSPTLLSSNSTSGNCQSIAIVGGRIFMAHSNGEIEVVRPQQYNSWFYPGEIYDLGFSSINSIAVSGDYVFSGTSDDRLLIDKITQNESLYFSATSNLFINAPADVKKIRVSATQTGAINWLFQQNGSYSAIEFPSQNTWVTPVFGTRWFSWTAEGIYDPNGPSTVDDVTFEWLYEYPQVEAVVDIGNDQGKQVRVEWSRSGNDFVGAADQIVEYGVYRKVDVNLVSKAASVSTAQQSSAMQAHSSLMKSSGWDFVASHQVLVKDRYSVVVPTLADSTISGGQYYSAFKVYALTATPGVFFESPADSGYSSDNLAPSAPMGVSAAYLADSVTLDWTDVDEVDVQYYRIYRSSDPLFSPSPATLVMSVPSSSWTDPLDNAWNEHYKITAVDFSGNESAAGQPAIASDVPGSNAAKRFALHNASPNPFNPATVISFDLPRASQVKLTIHDLAGRLVKTLVHENREAGSHQILWEGRNNDGGRVASGVYLYRIEAGSFADTNRMVLVK